MLLSSLYVLILLKTLNVAAFRVFVNQYRVVNRVGACDRRQLLATRWFRLQHFTITDADQDDNFANCR